MTVMQYQRFGRLSLQLFWIAFLIQGCSGLPSSTDRTQEELDEYSQLTFAEIEAIDERAPAVRQFCGSCHAVPLPQSFPKDAWYEEVRRGFDFYYQSERTDLSPPTPQVITDFYRHYAPAVLAVPDQQETAFTDVSFVPQEIVVAGLNIKSPPTVSFIDVRKAADNSMFVRFSDMRSGASGQFSVAERLWNSANELENASTNVQINLSGLARNPVALKSADLDGNGIDDFVLCDLGSFLPEDHDRGQLIWIPDGTSASPGTPVVLLEQLGRVADVCVGDFNSDGLPDLVVAEFGWYKTGGIHLLTNLGAAGGTMQFSHQLLDNRPGTIHVIAADLDNNGLLDFVALISQEHEKVVAFMNSAEGFHQKEIYAAPDPSWGSSGIDLVDLDGDGDLDVLYTNGDTFDSYLTKPFHGIWWLENKGTMPFEAHRLAALPGVHRALACDVDGDGDLDIVASALLPSSSSRNTDPQQLQALIWLEQIQPSLFVRHVIERGRPIYAAIAIHDVDSDGRPDIVAGCFHENSEENLPLVRVFRNTR